MTEHRSVWFSTPIFIGLGLLLIYGLWQWAGNDELPTGFASGNGRIESVEVDVAARYPGRIAEVLVSEGDFVSPGQVLARMDTATLDARLHAAQAELKQAQIGVEIVAAQVKQREAEIRAAQALLAQRQVELDAAARRLRRSEELAAKQSLSEQNLDDDRARHQGSRAAVNAAQAQVAAAEAALGFARSQVIAAQSQVASAEAALELIQADLDDSVLRATCECRVQYRIAEPGEVVAAGGKVLNLVNLNDVYMSFFLPTAIAGRLALGDPARLILDVAPQYVVPAEVSFVANVAQFTPRSVETEEERAKLMFRVKARIPVALLQKHLQQVKTGLPGMAYVRSDRNQEWPDWLAVKLPE
ncbi:MAG TPA: glycoside hydrolase family 43 [Gammaproteobacteria bacterium]|nr:glycoside hydrolase family 43 [Gammaproteobacteria bacterium]